MRQSQLRVQWKGWYTDKCISNYYSCDIKFSYTEQNFCFAGDELDAEPSGSPGNSTLLPGSTSLRWSTAKRQQSSANHFGSWSSFSGKEFALEKRQSHLFCGRYVYAQTLLFHFDWIKITTLFVIYLSLAGKPVPYLTEAKLLEIIEKCKQENSYSLLIRTIGETFSTAEAVSRSFQKTEKSSSPLAALLDRAPVSLLKPPGDLSKEAVRSLQGEDKEEDSSDPTPVVSQPDDTTVDLPSVRRAFEALWSLPSEYLNLSSWHCQSI